MKYQGSKRRLYKEILPIILENRKPNQFYVEPFVGGANIIQHVKNPRIGSDNNYYLIELLKKIQMGYEPPDVVTEEEYNRIKKDIKEGWVTYVKPFYYDAYIGFVGFCCSYAGKWLGGYARGNDNKGNPRNYALEQKKDLLKQAHKLKGIDFRWCDYKDLEIPPNSLIYCDIPYKNTTKYSTSKSFNYKEFYQWCREQHSLGHQIFVSEYEMPDDFICVWQKRIVSSLDLNTGGKTNLEKLWTLK